MQCESRRQGTGDDLGKLGRGATSSGRRRVCNCDHRRVNPSERKVDGQIDVPTLELTTLDDFSEHGSERGERLGLVCPEPP